MKKQKTSFVSFCPLSIHSTLFGYHFISIMPTTRITERQYNNAKRKMDEILDRHGPLESLRRKHDLYRRSNRQSLLVYYNKYRAYLRHNKKVCLYEELHDNEVSVQQCANCRRRQSPFLVEKFGEDSPYFIQFDTFSTASIRLRRPFKFLSRARNENNGQDVLLCKQCAHLIVIEDDIKVARLFQNAWPGFIYSLLQNRDARAEYGESIWRFIPVLWRHWWIDTFKSFHPTTTSLSITNPPAIFEDKTPILMEWDAEIQSFELPRLAKCLNKHLMPTTLCPFGCSEYIHQTGSLHLDLVFQRFLPRCLIELSHDVKDLSKHFPARDDFVRQEDEYDCLLLNPLWKVKPSIAFTDGFTPSVLSCREHKDGELRFILHTCRQPKHSLPAPISDQLSHCVIVSRLLKPIRPKAYSTEFQMCEQRGTFSGIDTFSVTEYGRFDSCSLLLSECEARTITCRPDINALLSQLVQKKVSFSF